MSNQSINPNKRSVFTSTRTVIGSENQVIRELGLPYIVKPNSTLNQLLQINANLEPPQTVIPKVGYYCIGMGGVDYQLCTNVRGQSPFPKIYQHMADDTGLFKMIPFVLRETNNDLSVAERQKYGLRRVEEIKGTRYYAYYLKRLDMARISLETRIFTKNTEGGYDDSEYVPTQNKLQPTVQELSPDSVNTLGASYAKVMAITPIVFDRNDANELFNVFNILEGDSLKAVVTEIGLVSGIDQEVTVPTISGNAQMKEVIAAQVCHINRLLVYLASNNDGFTSTFNLGINEPLFNVESKQQDSRP